MSCSLLLSVMSARIEKEDLMTIWSSVVTLKVKECYRKVMKVQ